MQNVILLLLDLHLLLESLDAEFLFEKWVKVGGGSGENHSDSLIS